MIYITGDCHGDFRRFSKHIFTEQKEMSKDDYVIICGDFGGIWNRDGEDNNEKYNLDFLDNKSYTTLFIDGNHENFDRLNSYPVKEWHGGKVHEIRPSVMHLMRGQVFEIEDVSFFAFGGASSHDIDGGILEMDDPFFAEKTKRLNREYIPYRINKLSWWQEELPSYAEMEEGRKNLKEHGNKVDFILTHCCSSSTQVQISTAFKPDIETWYLEDIKQTVDYKKWFMGHYHLNKNINDKEIVIYEQIIRII